MSCGLHREWPSHDAFRTLDDADVTGKRVLVRVDLNVPMENGTVTDATRIERVAADHPRDRATRAARSILLAHFGRPKGRDPKESLRPVAARPPSILEQAGRLRRGLHRRGRGQGRRRDEGRRHAAASRTPASTRARRRTIRPSSRRWPPIGDLYVNDAFSAAHRAHASTEGLAHVLPAYAGRTMQAELDALTQGARTAQAPGGRHRRRRQGLDQDRPARQPRHQGRCAGHRRRHGQHLPARPGHRRRQVARREATWPTPPAPSSRRRRQANCAIILPVDAVCAYDFKAGADTTPTASTSIPIDAHDPRCRPAIGRAHQGRDRRGHDAGLERPARRLRDRRPSTRARWRPPRHAAAAHQGRQAARRWPAAAIRSRRSTMPASRTASPMSRPPAAPSSNGWKASRCPASKHPAQSLAAAGLPLLDRSIAPASTAPALHCRPINGESHMARITLRQLLDHAAEHGYGVPAFNINNMEQALAIMEAANATDAPVIMQASRGARSYANDIMLKHDDGRGRPRSIRTSRSACIRTTATTPADLHDRDPGRLHLGDDGRLAQGRRQDPGRLRLQRRRHPPRRRHGPSGRHLGRRRARRAGLARDRHGREGRRPRRRGQAQPRPAAHRSRTRP